MSAELKRNFARRHITWKIKNFTKENVDKYSGIDVIWSSDFEILLNDNVTKWWDVKNVLCDESFH